MKRSFILILIVVLWLGSSCSWFGNRKPETIYVARVYDKYLLQEDIEGLIPAGTAAKDSIELTKTFIDSWISQMLLLHQAENNLDFNDDDFNREIEKYRNSLIIFRYESEFVNQKMDTSVTDEEIQKYYSENQGNFILHENIVRSDYVLHEKNRKDLNVIKTMLNSNKPGDLLKLTDYCRQNGIEHNINDSSWVTFSDLNAKIPLNSEDYDNFINGVRWYETSDSIYTYLVKIRELKIKEGPAPLSYERNRIKAAILNKRKSELLHKLERDLYNDASKQGKFEIF